MQISDREIQNTLDLLKEKNSMAKSRKRGKLGKHEMEEVRETVRQNLGEAPAVRQDRIEKVRKALENSSYNVSGDDVAKKLIGRMITDKLG